MFTVKLLGIETVMKMAQSNGWTTISIWMDSTDILRAFQGRPALSAQARPFFESRKKYMQLFTTIRILKVAKSLTFAAIN